MGGGGEGGEVAVRMRSISTPMIGYDLPRSNFIHV